MSNRDDDTIRSFGRECADFDHSEVNEQEIAATFEGCFGIFPWNNLPPDAEGVDVGSGSGRWARLVAPRVQPLHCIEPAAEACAVSTDMLAGQKNVTLYNTDLDNAPFEPDSLDFGYSLGVLHHIPDTPAALAKCVDQLKPGTPFLVYLYYHFENRPLWFRSVWKPSERVRWLISRLPERAKKLTTDVIAVAAYLPLAGRSWLVERLDAAPPADTVVLLSQNERLYDTHGQPRSFRHTARTKVQSRPGHRNDVGRGPWRYQLLGSGALLGCRWNQFAVTSM